MRVDLNDVVIVLQTVRLPHGRDQFVVPTGCSLNRRELLSAIDQSDVHAEHSVVQPETGRKGSEHLVALGSNHLAESAKVQLRTALAHRLHDVSSLIDDIEGDALASGDLPHSQILADWQSEIRNRLALAIPTRAATTTNHPPNHFGRLIVSLGLGVLLIALIAMIPRTFDSIRGVNPQEAETVMQSSVSFEGWNLTGSEQLPGESDLLKLLSPLVASSAAEQLPDASPQQRLTQLLAEINQLRLAQPKIAREWETESTEARLQMLLDDDALNSYVRILVRKDGTVDLFGLVNSNIHLASLRILLPKDIDNSTAVTFRQLAKQLTGTTEIGTSKKRIQQLEGPFSDLAEDHRDEFQAMTENVPREFTMVDSLCAFFTPDDCATADAIATYFIDLGFVGDGTLGFPGDRPLSGRARSYAKDESAKAHEFATLLIQWEAFSKDYLRDAQPNESTDDKPTVSNNP